MLKDSLNNIRKRIGFTDTEIKIVLFLAVVFIAGLAIKLTQAGDRAEYKDFDYSKSDSLYAAADTANALNERTVKEDTADSSVDSLLLRREDYKSKSKTVLKEKSISVNKASAEELTQLPGIGIKTAEKIIEYRTAHGKFKAINELLEVKGIGEKKLEKIKKIIFIE